MRDCANCHGELHLWSEDTLGSYGWACLECKLFWTSDRVGRAADWTWSAYPLDRAVFPMFHRNVPAFRTAVGWVGP